MSISQLPTELKLHIFNFTDKPLGFFRCKVVCKEFKNLIDKHQEDIYPFYMRNFNLSVKEAKLACQAYQKKQEEVDVARNIGYRARVETEGRCFKDINTTNTPRTQQGGFVSLILRITSVVKRLLTSILEFFNPEKRRDREQLERQKENKLKEVEQQEEKLRVEAEDLNKIWNEKFNNHTNLSLIKDVYEIMMDLFGGREEFVKLPVLKLDGQADDLTAALLKDKIKAPMMRGTYKKECEFFTLRARKGEEISYQVVYYTDKNGSENYCWASAGTMLGNCFIFTIPKSSKPLNINSTAYNQLLELIKNRRLGDYTLY